MIPIRNFPYTDYHDLNLDWLLRQLQIWEVDLEELKRRVKALEDWRTDTVDPDLRDIKLTIIDIQGDIRNLGDRVTIVEGNITTLSQNNVKYFIKLNDDNTVSIYKNDPDSTPLTDFTEFRADTNHTSTPSLGVKEALIYIGVSNSEFVNYKWAVGSPDKLSLTSVANVKNVAGTMFTYIDAFQVIVDFSSSIPTYTKTSAVGGLTRHVNMPINLAECVANDDPNLSGDYPYKYEYISDYINSDSCLELFFSSSFGYVNKSEDVCDYIKIVAGKATIYFKTNIGILIFDGYITGGN